MPNGGQEAGQTKSELWKYGHYLAYGVPPVERTNKVSEPSNDRKKVNDPDGGQTKSELWKYGHYLAYGVPGVPDGGLDAGQTKSELWKYGHYLAYGVSSLSIPEVRKAGSETGTYGHYLAYGVPGVPDRVDFHVRKTLRFGVLEKVILE